MTLRSERDSFITTIRFTGRVIPSVEALTAASSEGCSSARVVRASLPYPSGAFTRLYRRHRLKFRASPLPRVVHMEGEIPASETALVQKKK